ncbi:MAG: DoxX family protein, partial [Nanoarchaeota archaeon]|nr:DoxX family protein [Nanoarchaeota archaeon]
LFLQHGAQKLFGVFGGVAGDGQAVALLSLMGLAGIVEFFGGLAIALGFLTRLVAIVTALEMSVAYFMIHIPQGWIPFMNQGELALLYIATFLVLIGYGAKKWSLDKALFKQELF